MNLTDRIMKIIKIITEWISKHLVYILGAIILFLTVSAIITKCNDDIDDTIDQVDVNKLRRHLIDSIATEAHKRYIVSIDSINALREAQIKSKDKQIVSLDKENKKLRKQLEDIYNDNDTINLETCLEIVDIQQDIISNRDSVIDIQTGQIYLHRLTIADLNIKYDKQLSETDRVKSMYSGCQDDVLLLQKKLEQQNTWWKKNEKWIYLGVGVIGTAILVK